MILISIIISTYSEYQTGQLQQAVFSILRQTYQNWELVIVGDCAPDANQIYQFLTKINDNRIKFINLAKRAGTASPGTIPKIKAIEIAGGDLLCFLDGDNLYLPDHLTRCARAFDDDPKLDLVYGDTVIKISTPPLPAQRAGMATAFSTPPMAAASLKKRKTKNDIYTVDIDAPTMPARRSSSAGGGRVEKLLSFVWTKPDWTPKRQKLLLTSNFLDMSETVFTRKAYFDAGGLNASHHASDWLLWKAMIGSGHNNFKHLNHLGLIYHTNSLSHHLQYFMLMMMQKLGLRYQSEKLRWMQGRIKKRFARKYA